MLNLDNPQNAAQTLLSEGWEFAVTDDNADAKKEAAAALIERCSPYFKPGDKSPSLSAEHKLVCTALHEIQTGSAISNSFYALSVLAHNGFAPKL